MKRTFLLLAFVLSVYNIYAENNFDITQEITDLKVKQVELDVTLKSLEKAIEESNNQIFNLKNENITLRATIDSLSFKCIDLEEKQNIDRKQTDTTINEIFDIIHNNGDVMIVWILCGIGFIIVFAISMATTFNFLQKRINKGTTSIDEVRKAQDALEEAQKKMQEESIKLDNQLLELLDKQLQVINDNKTTAQSVKTEPDHSLVIKQANEIAKIETNLSKMDKSVRGYKQLVQAKDKMINNVTAYGYEIISLIGQEYNDGMQFPARFVPDESLEEGKRIITGMVKMQVNYNGKMIQAAEIVVNQNI